MRDRPRLPTELELEAEWDLQFQARPMGGDGCRTRSIRIAPAPKT